MSFSAEFQVINYYPCDKGFSTSIRVFDYPYLLYVHSGKGEYKIGNRRYECRRGDMLFCKSGVENTIIADETIPFVLSGLEFTVSDEKYLNEHLLERINIADKKELEAYINKMIEEYLYDKIYGKEICTNILHILLFELFRIKTANPRAVQRADAKQILRYIAEHYNEKLTNDTLGQEFHYHRNTVNRLIKASTGSSVKEYVIGLRIKEAKKYLLFSDKSVEQIAFLLGYSSVSFFCQQFKCKTGVSPAGFRNRR